MCWLTSLKKKSSHSNNTSRKEFLRKQLFSVFLLFYCCMHLRACGNCIHSPQQPVIMLEIAAFISGSCIATVPVFLISMATKQVLTGPPAPTFPCTVYSSKNRQGDLFKLQIRPRHSSVKAL